MSNLPPVPHGETSQDAYHIQLLCIFYYILAFFMLLGLGFIFLHYLIFSSIFPNPAFAAKNPMPFKPEMFLLIFYCTYALLGSFLLVMLVGNLLAAHFLRCRTHMTFTMVMAGLNCFHFPFGTALGVFTFILLSRPTVRETYAERSSAPLIKGLK